MIKPTIHLNGTSAKELHDNYAAAAQALLHAMKTLQQTTPHGRDYYPQGDAALTEAAADHVSRLKRINSVLVEIIQLTQHAQDYIELEQRRR